MEQFPEYKRIHLGPDSEALYYYRMLGQRFVLRDWKMMQRQIIMYPKYVRLERKYVSDGNAVYFQVGDEDAKFVRNLNPNCHAVFLRHPHYDVKAEVNKEVKFHTPIRLLVAGQYNLYMKQSADELIDTLCSCHDIELKSSYEITFLGKGWEQHVMRLNQKGWHAKQIRFAPNYIEEIIKHDIQVTPITIGTGTKGKVLDAIANGLLVIGTPYAMENIAVEDGESCILYNCSAQVVDILEDIVHNIVRYEKMAEEGRKAVLKQHDRKTLSKQLLSFFN
jgi:glycosyltransferase involved in cell wall biosynthesis